MAANLRSMNAVKARDCAFPSRLWNDKDSSGVIRRWLWGSAGAQPGKRREYNDCAKDLHRH
jgi:hypothetical protein